MSKIVIIGTGGHAREVIDILVACQANGSQIELLGFVDENPQKHGRIISAVPVLGDFGWFHDVDPNTVEVICAVGTPRKCETLATQASNLGLRFATAISPRAWISPHAQIGHGVIIFPNVCVNTGAVIDDHVTLNAGVTVSHDSIVRRFCNINPGVHLAGNVTVHDGTYLGMGANVIQGTSIGPWSVVGAGAAVTHDIPPHATAVGVPARVVKVQDAHPLAPEGSASYSP